MVRRHVVVNVEAAVEAMVEAVVVEAVVAAVEAVVAAVEAVEVVRVVALPLDCATQMLKLRPHLHAVLNNNCPD
jgi:hypothetical protein